ncbi:unnamed protein product [Orchesella dallaii]|uniref:B-block binding subunit of TFIIIC domain-containing protein n=1 Tax=Orchesella dallaii TaxID=48710 RepID=A0ABP1PMP8_9HEXA
MAPNIGPKHDNSGQGPSTFMSKTSGFDILLQEVPHLHTKDDGRHYIYQITDEIALEGLDGITLQALTVRLEQCPNFKGFEDVVGKSWDQLKRCKSFKFCILLKERPELINYSWNDYRDDRGNACEPAHAPDDIYPYFPIEDTACGVRGSCEHYKTRKEVSNVVRRVPFEESIRLFGSRLIIIANQSVREKALFGTNFRKYQGLSIAQYCVMERIGRSRYKGEITRGKISLQTMKVPGKTLFYVRKVLLEEKLVTKQTASIKLENCKCPALITVFHLPRFYKRIESLASLNTRVIFAKLNNSETKSLPRQFIVAKYGKHMLRKLLDQFPELLETVWEKPNSTTQTELQENEPLLKIVKSKAVKVLRLKVDNVDLSSILKVLEGQSVDEPESAEKEDRDEVKMNSQSSKRLSNIKHLRSEKQLTSVTQNVMLSRALLRAGVKGLTAKEMTYFGFTTSEARSVTNSLISNNIAMKGIVKNYKQKSFTYTFSKFAEKEKTISSTLQQSYEAALTKRTELRESKL